MQEKVLIIITVNMHVLNQAVWVWENSTGPSYKCFCCMNLKKIILGKLLFMEMFVLLLIILHFTFISCLCILHKKSAFFCTGQGHQRVGWYLVLKLWSFQSHRTLNHVCRKWRWITQALLNTKFVEFNYLNVLKSYICQCLLGANPRNTKPFGALSALHPLVFGKLGPTEIYWFKDAFLMWSCWVTFLFIVVLLRRKHTV